MSREFRQTPHPSFPDGSVWSDLSGWCSVCGVYLERTSAKVPMLDPETGKPHSHSDPWKLGPEPATTTRTDISSGAVPPRETLLPLDVVAEELEIGRSSLYRWVEAGDLPTYHPFGRRPYVRLGELFRAWEGRRRAVALGRRRRAGRERRGNE